MDIFLEHTSQSLLVLPYEILYTYAPEMDTIQKYDSRIWD